MQPEGAAIFDFCTGLDAPIANIVTITSWQPTARRRTFKVRGDGPPGTPPKRWTRQTSTSSSTMLVTMPMPAPNQYAA